MEKQKNQHYKNMSINSQMPKLAFEAESVAYTVCQYFGLDTSDYSFPYIAGWSSGRNMQELRESMDIIRKTAGELIETIGEKLKELASEKEMEIAEDDIILKIAGSMGSEYSYNIVRGSGKEDLLKQLHSYWDNEMIEDIDVESYLSEQGMELIPVADSSGLNEEHPVIFFDVEYDYDTGVTDVMDLSIREYTEMILDRAEYEKPLFYSEEKEAIFHLASMMGEKEIIYSVIYQWKDAIAEPDMMGRKRMMESIKEELDFFPDASLGMEDMYSYGYDYVGMYPLTYGRARELYDKGLEIFMLYPDGTEKACENREDISETVGMFGVGKEVWWDYREQVKEFEKEQFQEIELFDVPALFSNGRVNRAVLPQGMYRYELRGADYDPGYPIMIEDNVVVNHAATILTAFPIDLSDHGLWLGEEIHFTGGMQTAKEYLQMVSDRDLDTEQVHMENAIGRANEERYLLGQEERYAIYQINPATKGRDYRFMRKEFVDSHGMTVDAADYVYIYGGKLRDGETLDSLYERFNLNHPDNYYGHSLSVSDVVVLQKEDGVKAYYVDSFGFQELPEFIQQRLHEVQMNRKRDYAPVTMDTTAVEIEQHEGEWHPVEKIEIQEEIFYLMKHNEYGDSVAAVIVSSDGELVAQELEHGFDHKAMETIREYLAGKGIEWVQEGQKIYLPVYHHTLTYAMEHAAVDDYLDSRRLNIRCKEDVEGTIRDNFDGVHLKDGVIDSVLKEYGTERLSFVLACTVQNKMWDGRFSRATKEWASGIAVEENISRGKDMNLDYVVESHPAVLDGFINLFRDRTAEPKTILSYYVAECMEFPSLGEYHDNLTIEDAVTLYESIPVERMNGVKGIGFILHTEGSEPQADLEMGILSGNVIDVDMINHVPEFRESPLVQEAIQDIKTLFPNMEVWDQETKKREQAGYLTDHRERNPLAKVEELQEANDNQIDGIINNEPVKRASKKEEMRDSILECLKRNREKGEKEKSVDHKTRDQHTGLVL